VAHALAEQILRGHPHYEIGAVVVEQGFEIEVTEEMLDHVTSYVEAVQAAITDAGKGAIVRFEEKVELKEVNAVMFGTADCVIVEPFKRVQVFDLKFGQGKRVSAWQNKQLMYYALGIALKEDCPKFKIHICQPRVEDGFTCYEGAAEELAAFELELKVKAELALSKDAPLVPGDWCKATFCPNRTACRALSGLARDITVKDFDELPVVDVLTMEQITRVLKYEDTVKDWMGKVRDHAKELMLQGVDIPGYKVVQAIGNAKWIDEEAIKAEFEEEFGDKLFEKKLLSPAKFEKLAGKKRLGKEFREEYTVRPENGFKVVEIDEKGETVKKTKAQEDFE
jgi:molybdopterin-guanine dinucleotide biosynthesis protein